MAKRYVVSGTQPVDGHKPGEEFTADYSDARERYLLRGRHITPADSDRTPTATPATSTKDPPSSTTDPPAAVTDERDGGADLDLSPDPDPASEPDAGAPAAPPRQTTRRRGKRSVDA